MNKLVLIWVSVCVCLCACVCVWNTYIVVCKKACLISYQGRPNWHRGITPLCEDSKRDVNTLDVSISNNCDLEARGIAVYATHSPLTFNSLTAEFRACWFLDWRANWYHLGVFLSDKLRKAFIFIKPYKWQRSVYRFLWSPVFVTAVFLIEI